MIWAGLPSLQKRLTLNGVSSGVIWMGTVYDTQERLKAAWSLLQAQWESTRSRWLDPVSDHFQEEWWMELETEVPKFLAELSNLDDILDKASRNTE
jgi:hypothetical protein